MNSGFPPNNGYFNQFFTSYDITKTLSFKVTEDSQCIYPLSELSIQGDIKGHFKHCENSFFSPTNLKDFYVNKMWIKEVSIVFILGVSFTM